MRTAKYSIIWASIFSGMSLGISIILQYKGYEYASNLTAGLFASGFLALLIAIINYRTECIRALENIYKYGAKVAKNFNNFENEGDLERSIDSVLLMDQFDYAEFDDTLGYIDFFLNNRKKQDILKDAIYVETFKHRAFISQICLYFKDYRKGKYGNKEDMQSLIAELEIVFMDRAEKSVKNDYETITEMDSCQNKIAGKMQKILNETLYKMTYPHKRGTREFSWNDALLEESHRRRKTLSQTFVCDNDRNTI